MKKVLVVLLVLAVAGGLFGQVAISGSVNAGIGVLWLGEKDGSDARVGIIGKNDGQNGGRAQVNFAYTNEAKNAGAFVRIRFNGYLNNSVQPRIVYGWLSAFDNALTVYGGRFGGGALRYSTMDIQTDCDLTNKLDGGTGLWAVIKPIDIFSFGIGATVGAVPGAQPNDSGGGNDKTVGFKNIQPIVGLGIHHQVFNLAIQFAFIPNVYNQEVAETGKWDALGFWVMDKAKKPAAWTNKSYAYGHLSAKIDAVKGLPIIFTALFDQISQFDKIGKMLFVEQFGFNMVKNLSLNLALTEAVSQAKTDKEIFFRGYLWVTYALNEGKVIPRFDIDFAMGGRPFTQYGGCTPMYNNATFAPTFAKEMWLSLSPAVKFKVDKSTIEIGYRGYIGLADGAKDKLKNGVFIDLATSF